MRSRWAQSPSLTAVRTSGSTAGGLVAGMAMAAFALVAGAQGGHALLIYSAEGSSINGSLGGTAFTDASWFLQASQDETNARFIQIPIPGRGTIQAWTMPAQPRLRLSTAAGPLEAELLTNGAFSWSLLSGTFPVGPTPKIGFVYTTPSFFPEFAAGLFGVPGLFTDLKTPVDLVAPSAFEANIYKTSLGDLTISSFSSNPGRFWVTPPPVPNPLPLVGAYSALAWSRRLRTRLRQGQSQTRRKTESNALGGVSLGV